MQNFQFARGWTLPTWAHVAIGPAIARAAIHVSKICANLLLEKHGYRKELFF
jgi:hypothetical protein